MTHSPDVAFRHASADFQRLYQAISQDPRYGHYVRIPGRICRCLDYFNVAASRRAVHERLQAYYLFIGVADEAIDSSRLEAGREILEWLWNRAPFVNDETASGIMSPNWVGRDSVEPKKDMPDTARRSLASPFETTSRPSHVSLVTEVLKSHISPEIYPMVLAKLEELYQAVVRAKLPDNEGLHRGAEGHRLPDSGIVLPACPALAQ